MQLSLSSSVSASPEPALPGVPAADTLNSPSGQTADPATPDSFEEYLPADEPSDPPATEEKSPDAEKTASILATAGWIPAAAIPVATVPEPVPTEPLTGETSDATEQPEDGCGSFSLSNQGAKARSSVFFAAPSARAFATVVSRAAAPDESAAAVADLAFSLPVAGDPAAGTDPVAPTGVKPATAPAADGLAGELSEGTPGADGQPVTENSAFIASPKRAGASARRSGSDFAASATATAAGQPARDGQIPTVEKFAAASRAISAASAQANLAEKKDFLNTGRAAVSAADPAVGIGVAQARSDMPAVQTNRSKTVTLVESLSNVTATLDRAQSPALAPEAPAQPASVRETMAAVVSAVEALERRTDAVQKAVDLQFDVGSERLALRVELRDGTVHTTFRTESSELRSALTHEWQAVVQPAAGRELRLADPVFSSSSGPAGDGAQGSPGQGTPQQRGQQSAEPSRFSPTYDLSEAAAPASASAPALAPQTSSLLQAFA